MPPGSLGRWVWGVGDVWVCLKIGEPPLCSSVYRVSQRNQPNSPPSPTQKRSWFLLVSLKPTGLPEKTPNNLFAYGELWRASLLQGPSNSVKRSEAVQLHFSARGSRVGMNLARVCNMYIYIYVISMYMCFYCTFIYIYIDTDVDRDIDYRHKHAHAHPYMHLQSCIHACIHT